MTTIEGEFGLLACLCSSAQFDLLGTAHAGYMVHMFTKKIFERNRTLLSAKVLTLLAAAGALTVTTGTATVASAATDQGASIRSVTWSADPATAGSPSFSLTLNFTSAKTPRQVAQLQRKFYGNSPVSETTRHVAAAASSPILSEAATTSLKCDHGYSFSDAAGAFTIQHQCASTTGPWGFKISAAVCSAATSSVSEHGMSWSRNGSGQPRQKPHVEPCDYQFHGTFNPDHDDDHIVCDDEFDFATDEGEAIEKEHCDVITTGIRWVKTSTL